MAAMRPKRRFLLCIRNTGCEDLELHKVYERLPDGTARREGYVRVVDESHEDYLYPEAYFVAVKVPRDAERAFARRLPARGSDPRDERPSRTGPRARGSR